MKSAHLILGKIVKFVVTRRQIFEGKNAPNSISAGAPPQTALAELTALPQAP